jgi:hypothetical protein
MAVELIGRSAQANESSSRSRRYVVTGAADEAAAIAELVGAVPGSIGGLVLRNIAVDEEVQDGYRCEVQYGQFRSKEPPAKGESQFNFEISAQPVRVVVPLAPQTVYPRSGVTAPNSSAVAKWLIGDQGDGRGPEGCEVYEPITSFSETHYIDAATLTQTYRNTLMRVVGKVNNAAFKGFDAGEVLCQAISGSKRGFDDWEVTFRFAMRENQTGIEVAGITGIDKEGWQFLWPKYHLEEDPDAPILTNVIDYIVVADVLKKTAFSALGIG